MTDWHDELRYQPSTVRVRVAVPVTWLALLLSLLIHLAALIVLVPQLDMSARPPTDATTEAPMSVRIAEAAQVPRASVAEQAPSTPTPARTPTPREAPPPPRAPTPPRVTAPRTQSKPATAPALPQPAPTPPPPIAPSAPLPPPPPTPSPPMPVPTPPAPPTGGDLASYIASRRLARGASPDAEPRSPADEENARRDRAIAANIASMNSRTFNESPKQSGGVFQILSMTYNDAEFAFFGWNRDINRRANMRIEVHRTAQDADIRQAIIRRMISIIREYEVQDFTWESRRLGRNVRLSARLEDPAGLEDFLMKEFFEDGKVR